MGATQQVLSALKAASSAPPVFVQQETGSGAVGGGSEPITISFGASTAAGNAIVVCVSHTTGTLSITTADTLDALTLVVSKVGTGIITDIWIITNAASNAGVNIDADASTVTEINISEWSGLNNAGAEATNNNSGIASSTVTTNSVTPASTRNLVIAVGGWTANDYSTGPTNSFTRMTVIGSGAVWQESAYLIQTSATAKSTGWGLTAGINWASAIAVFGGP